MTIDELDQKLNKIIMDYTMRIDEQYNEPDAPITQKDVVEIAKETSDHLAVFKQEIIRFFRDIKNGERI